MFDKLFDCLNVSKFSEGKKVRKPFTDPWRKGDLRLKVSVYFICNNVFYTLLLLSVWLEEEPYLSNWESSVRARKEFSVAEQNKMLLSIETRLGLEFTGKRIVQYCDNNLCFFFFTCSEIIHRSCETCSLCPGLQPSLVSEFLKTLSKSSLGYSDSEAG